MEKQELLRRIPSVEQLLEHHRTQCLLSQFPRWIVGEAIRSVTSLLRERILSGEATKMPEMEDLIEQVERHCRRIGLRGIRKVINGTGILIHTNLGRSLISPQARRAIDEIAGYYSSLEIDLESGKRISRLTHLEMLLTKIIGCQAATVVNNNAAAVLIVLNTVAEGKEVIVSRGELIEIGGSFRLPEVMKKSGAIMVEVGTTNKTRVDDYRNALTPRTAAILKVHRSNFKMIGFVESVEIGVLAEIARSRNIVLIEDLGSGALFDFSKFGLEHEPMPQESLKQGADLVTFSGDKLLFGPQAGIIVGKKDLVDRIKSNPLARALRLDKLTIAGLEETLRHYLEPDGLVNALPMLRMIAIPTVELWRRAENIKRQVEAALGSQAIGISKERAEVGGGSLPGVTVESVAIEVSKSGTSPDDLCYRLRMCEPPVITRISNDRVLIDLRTVLPEQDQTLAEKLIEVLG